MRRLRKAIAQNKPEHEVNNDCSGSHHCCQHRNEEVCHPRPRQVSRSYRGAFVNTEEREIWTSTIVNIATMHAPAANMRAIQWNFIIFSSAGLWPNASHQRRAFSHIACSNLLGFARAAL